MKKQTFALQPFEKVHGIKIKGRVARSGNTLTAHYELKGDLLTINIPRSKHVPSRVKGLWGDTCFELFLAPEDNEKYWEINVSPSGDWNIFRFDHYEEARRISDLQEETLVASLPFEVRERPGSLSLDFELSLDKFVRKEQILEIGISAVIKSGIRSYWALAHCDTKPNFHRRDSFILKL